MAQETGVPAIKRLLISLAVIGAIVCGALYAIVTPPKPIIKPVAGETPTRSLAYQQQIARPDDTATTSDQETKQQQATVPSETPSPKPKPGDAAPAQSAPASTPQAAAPTQPKSQAPAPQQDAPPEMAGLPPDDEAYDPDALPWQQRGQPYHPGTQGEGHYQPGMSGENGYAPGPMGAWPGEDGPPQGEAWPGEDADPNAWPAGPGEQPQEWVQVLVSGAGMHAAAAEGAPMMFAFPYGRTLRVISRYGNWVEVTDPQSATTGWMKAQYLAPVARPRPHHEAQPWYGEEPPRRRGWFRGQGGGLADMINRALGGY